MHRAEIPQLVIIHNIASFVEASVHLILKSVHKFRFPIPILCDHWHEVLLSELANIGHSRYSTFIDR